MLALIALVVVALASSPALRLALSLHPSLCLAADGKWASVESRCITRACYRGHDCGHWAHPAARCSRLRIGDPLGEVYFQLGEPDGEDGGKLWWWASKMRDAKIVAQIEDGKLTALNCPLGPVEIYREFMMAAPA